MPGISYVGRRNGLTVPIRSERLLSNSIAAASATNPALYSGDIVVLTNIAALTGASPNNPAVIRRLSRADGAAFYADAGPIRTGVLGVTFDNVITNATGQVIGSPHQGAPPGNAILNMPNEAGAIPVDPVTGRSRLNVFIADPTMVFMARINVNTTTFAAGLTLGHQFDNVRAGIAISANGNQGIFTIDTAATNTDVIATNKCPLIILGPNESDPNYGKLVLGTDTLANLAIADARSGPTVLFSFAEEYCQALNGRPYPTNSGGAI